MRFKYGPPPESTDFNPTTEEGWVELKEPKPHTLVLVGSLLGVPLAVAIAFGWEHLVGDLSLSLQPNLGVTGNTGKIVLAFVPLALLVVFFAMLIIVHELCHAFCTPHFGLSKDTVIGAWPKKLLFYAGYMQEMSRTRFLVMSAAPFLILSLLPLIVSVLFQASHVFWSILSTVNALLCGGDLIILYLILTQLPANSVIRNQGWNSWWRKT